MATSKSTEQLKNYRISDEIWYKKNVMKWSLYDLGNTIFSMVVVSLTISPLIYILYFEQLGNARDAVNRGNVALSVTLLIGNITMAVLSPFLGAYSDKVQSRRPLLLKITFFCLLFMSLLVVSAYVDNIILILFIFLLANLFYQMGLIVYDAMLPFITDEDKIGKVAGYGVALGYFGSFIGIGLGFLLIPIFGDFYAKEEYKFDNGTVGPRFEIGYIPYIYPLAAFLFLLFTIPMFSMKEKPKESLDIDVEALVDNVSQQVAQTAREVWNYKSMRLFLIGWLIYVDTANTVILFMTPIIQIGLEFGESGTVLAVLGIGVLAAVLFTYPVGVFVDKYGPKKGLTLITSLWCTALVLGFLTNYEVFGYYFPKWLVYIFPVILGPGLGGTWVIQRSYVTQLAPPEKVGNYFGFSNIFGRISAAVGPFVWTASVFIISDLIGTSSAIAHRFSVLTLLVLMLIGYFILLRVVDVHKYYIDGAKATGNETWVKDGEQVYPPKL